MKYYSNDDVVDFFCFLGMALIVFLTVLFCFKVRADCKTGNGVQRIAVAIEHIVKEGIQIR